MNVREERDILATNAISRSEAKRLHHVSIIIGVAGIAKMTLWNEFVCVCEVGRRMISGIVRDRNDGLEKKMIVRN
jgi:hypothetical protein